MIKLVQTILLLSLSYCTTYAQGRIIFKPDSFCGKDAIMTNSPTWSNGIIPNLFPIPSSEWLRCEAWTANAHGSPEHDWRSVIEFVALKNIQSASVNSATLVLYAYPNFPHSNGGQAEANASQIYRVIEDWEEENVNWVTQPAIDATVAIEIPQNNNYDVIEVDVTAMVQEMINDPNNSFGFLIRQRNEDPYGSMNFSSSDNPDYARAPELIIEAEDVHYLDDDELDLLANTTYTICWDSTLTLQPTINPNLVEAYLWSNGSTQNSITINAPGTYWVEVQLEDCTSLYDAITVVRKEDEDIPFTCQPRIPDVFTPNSDGVNDYFKVLSASPDCYNEFELKIFNRWGNLVFRSNDPNHHWDGKVNGVPATSDVYIYTLIYSLIDTNAISQLKGDLSLLR